VKVDAATLRRAVLSASGSRAGEVAVEEGLLRHETRMRAAARTDQAQGDQGQDGFTRGKGLGFGQGAKVAPAQFVERWSRAPPLLEPAPRLARIACHGQL
jgi:hypothetical protein